MNPCVLIEAIAADFLFPTTRRLNEQLRRTIYLNVRLKIGDETAERRINTETHDGFAALDGEVRILASDTAIPDRYKYILQCVFESDETLHGFSGIRMNGAVTLNGGAATSKHAAFTYAYNDWSWGPKLRGL